MNLILIVDRAGIRNANQYPCTGKHNQKSISTGLKTWKTKTGEKSHRLCSVDIKFNNVKKKNLCLRHVAILLNQSLALRTQCSSLLPSFIDQLSKVVIKCLSRSLLPWQPHNVIGTNQKTEEIGNIRQNKVGLKLCCI